MAVRTRAEFQVATLHNRAETDSRLDGCLLDKHAAEQLFSPEEWEQIGLQLGFSRRELSIATLLVAGYTRDEIASCLRKAGGRCLSSDTVRVYVDRLYVKTDVRDRLGLARCVFRTYLSLRGGTSMEPAPSTHREPSKTLAGCEVPVPMCSESRRRR